MVTTGNIELEMEDNNNIQKRPASVGKLIHSWLTSQALLAEAEDEILKYLNTPYKRQAVDIGKIVGQTNSKIWTLSMNESSDQTPLVLVHGLGAGLAMWIMNMDEFAQTRPVYAIDILGFGRSSRPTFSTDPTEVESQMADALEAWRIKMKLDKFILMGHSLGGYLTTGYCIRYPDHVARLILADPWGFQDKPKNLNETTLQFRIIAKMCDSMNPLSVIRLAGWMGPKLIQKIRPDLSHNYQNLLEGADCKISNYLYHCNARNPTGETAYHTLMSSLAWAKNPMGRRLHLLSPNIALTLIYGKDTWVDHIPFEFVRKIRGNSTCDTHILEGAGHHLYTEKRSEFNRQVLASCFATDEELDLELMREVYYDALCDVSDKMLSIADGLPLIVDHAENEYWFKYWNGMIRCI